MATVLHEPYVEAGDIWRSASRARAPIEDWVNLAIARQKAEGCQAIFWLDAARAHDAELIAYVTPILEAEGVCRQVPDHGPTRSHARIAGNDPQRRELDRDHRQRAARLSDRSVPDS